MSGLRINRLRVSAFRGITGTVELDLRPPLTVLYAANGTGKTTLCDATEWLLTGQVHRFCTGNAFDSGLLVSKFAPRSEPAVEAELELDGRPLFLQRNRSGARLGTTPADARRVQLGALLATLTAPARQDAGWEPHHLTAIRRRQQFLRATHVLTAEELATLLDTDPETLGRRKEIFADLSDIREEHDSAGRLKRYADALLPDENVLIQAVEGVKGELVEAFAALRRAGPRPSDEEADLGERRLGIRTDLSGPRRVEALAAEIGRRRQALTASMSAMGVVDEGWHSRRPTVQALTDFTADEGRLAKSLGVAADRAEELASRMRAATESVGRFERLGEELAGFRGAVSPRLPEIAAAAVAASLPFNASIVTLRRLPEARMSAALRQERAAELRSLARQAADLPERRRRIVAIEAKLAQLVVSQPNEQAALQREAELATASSGLEAARRRLTEIGQPLERLRAEALAFLDHRHVDTGCPVCGHDWRTQERLRASVEAMLGAPSLVAGLEREVADGERRVRQARAAVATTARAREEADGLARSRAQEAQILADCEHRVRQFGLDADRPDLPGAISRLSQRIDAVEALVALEDELGPRTARFRSSLPADTPLRLAAGAFSERMEAELASASREMQVAQAAVTAAAEALQNAHAEAEDIRRRLAAVRERIGDLRLLRDRFTRAWAVVAGDARVSVQARNEARTVYESQAAAPDAGRGPPERGQGRARDRGRPRACAAARSQIGVRAASPGCDPERSGRGGPRCRRVRAARRRGGARADRTTLVGREPAVRAHAREPVNRPH